MSPKRKATYSACPEVKKPRRHSPPPTSQPKATRDIRFFFTSQGSPLKKRMTGQDSTVQALKQDAEKEKEDEKEDENEGENEDQQDKATAAAIEKDATTEAITECPESPPKLCRSDSIKLLNRKILDDSVSVFDVDNDPRAKDIDKIDSKTGTPPLLRAFRNAPPRDWSPSPPCSPVKDAAKLAAKEATQKNEKTPKTAEKPMLLKALEDAKEATTPTVQSSIESAVVVDHPTKKKAESPEEPLRKEEEDAKPKFDKEKWAKENLTGEQRELLGLEIQTLDASWFEVLKDELKSKSFLDLKKFLMAEHKAGKTIFPPAEDVYSWSRHTPLSTVKAVILGQDPYHNHNQAHGLCFSVRPPTPAPPSLKNIYKALAIEFPDFKPPPNNGGLLTPWANRGVLMLNACLTVRAHNANSHANKGWEKFTQKVIDIVASGKKGVVFLAWGLPAAKRVAKVDGKKHLILKGVHPSPLSAHRGFFDLGHFKKCNEWLEEKYGEGKGIDWSLDVDPQEVGV